MCVQAGGVSQIYCGRVRQTMPLSHYTSCSHLMKNTLWSKEQTDNMPYCLHTDFFQNRLVSYQQQPSVLFSSLYGSDLHIAEYL